MKYKIEKSTIIDFIDKFREDSRVIIFFQKKFSYYFATILNERFNKAGMIMFLPEKKRFFCKLFGKVYDITGEIVDEEILSKLILWDLYVMKYDKEANEVIEECILKISQYEE